MNEYIFYTPEGYTEAPNPDVVVENCQVLGCAKGNNASEAMQNLLNENSWIIAAGFHLERVITKELLNDEDISASPSEV